MLDPVPSRSGSTAFVKFADIKEINTTTLDGELAFNDPALDPRLSQIYDRADYDSKPKTREEAESLGVKGFNGLQTSCRLIEQVGDRLNVTLQPARYLLSEAMESGVKNGRFGNDNLFEISPRLANVSAIAVVRDSKTQDYYLVGRLKGYTRGENEVHAAQTAVGVTAEYLKAENPLLAALGDEARKENGPSNIKFSPSDFLMMIDESPIGLVNFVAVSSGLGLDDLRESFWQRTRGLEVEKLKARGLGLLPVAGLVLIPMEQRQGVKGVRIITPTEQGLTETSADTVARPYTVALAGFLEDPANQKMILERAGY